MFNWMLGQLRKVIGRSCVGEKAPSLNRLSRARKMEKTSPSTQFSVRAILSRVYVQLDARPIEEGLWEGRFLREGRTFVEELELESAKQCTPHPQPNSVFAQFSAVCMFNWMLGQLRKDYGKIVS